MKRDWSLRIVALALLAAMLLAAFAPLYTPRAQASQELIRLTIDNRTTSELKLWLEGKNFYFLKVPASAVKTFTIARGAYDYRVYGCGRTATGEVALLNNTRMVNPVCGGNTADTGNNPYFIDLARVLKVVPVMLENEANEKVLVVMTGTSTYVFVLKPGEERKVTLGKGGYTVKYTVCGTRVSRHFDAFKNATLTISCP